MLARGLVLLLLLAPSVGCLAQPQGAPVRSVALDDEPWARTECLDSPCGWEWWNLTAEGEGVRVVVPVPVAWPTRIPPPHQPRAPDHEPAYPWHRNLTVRPDVMSGIGVSDHVALFSAPFSRELTAQSHQVRSQMPEEFLRARWGPLANQTRPDAIEVRGHGTLHGLALTYEAHSEHCRREARYEWQGTALINGSIWVGGRDVVVCR